MLIIRNTSKSKSFKKFKNKRTSKDILGKDILGKCEQKESRNCFTWSDSRIWSLKYYKHYKYHFTCFCNGAFEYVCMNEYTLYILPKEKLFKINYSVIYDLWNKTRYQICSTTRLLSLKRLLIFNFNDIFSIWKLKTTYWMKTPQLGLCQD